MKAALAAAENLAHHANQLQRAGIANPIINAVGFLARDQNTLFAKNGKMLGNVALRSAYGLDNLLNTGFLIPDHAKDLESQGMRYRLQRTRCLLNMLLLVNETARDRHDTPDSSFII